MDISPELVSRISGLTAPEEIAAMAVYLSSGYAAHMIGANVDVSGGLPGICPGRPQR